MGRWPPRARRKLRPASAWSTWSKPAPGQNASESRTEGLFLRHPEHTMAISVVMPALELTQESGKLLAWRKKEGESVSKGEPLLEVETDKAVVEIEGPGDGILAGVRAHEGAVIPVGQTIAWIVRPGEQPPTEAATVEAGDKVTVGPARPASAAPQPHAQTTPQTAAAAPRLSPKARRLAKEHGVEISLLRGSGPDGEILAEGVLAFVESKGGPATRPPPARTKH